MDLFASLPRDIDNISHMCQKLFDLPLPFQLSIADFKLYWPFIDNVYVIRKTRHVTTKSGDFKRHLVDCRFKRTYNIALSSSLRPRTNITKQSKKQYYVSFRLLEYSDHMDFHVLKNHSFKHDYSLDESDTNKRNSGLLGLAQYDIAKSYTPAAVISLITGYGQSDVKARLKAASGSYLTRQDAINSGAS